MSTATVGQKARVRGSEFVAIGIVAIVTAALVVFPLGSMLFRLAFQGADAGPNPIIEALELPSIGTTLINTTIVIGASGIIALLVGTFFAWLNERTDARMGWIAAILPIIPILMPPIAIAIGWVFLLSPRAGTLNVGMRAAFDIGASQGPLNIFSWYGIIGLYALELIPFVYLIVAAALRNLDPALEQASRLSGAGALSTLRRVTLPMIKPALVSSAFLILVIGMSIVSIPSVLGGTARIDMLSTRIVELLNGSYPPRTGPALVLSGLMLVVLALAWLIQTKVLRSGRYAGVGGKWSGAGIVRLGVWRWPARAIIVLFVLIATVFPIVGLIVVSLQRFWTAAIRPSTFTLRAYAEIFVQNTTGAKQAMINSITLAVVTASACMALAVLQAMLARRKRFSIVRILDAAMKLPAGFPHVVIAVSMLVSFAGPPIWLGGTIFILLIGYFVIYLPQASISAGAAVSQVRDELIEASLMSGASGTRTVRRISLPLMLPGIISGWVVVFVFAVGDLTASVILASHNTPTAGYFLLEQYVSGSYPLIAALSLVMTVASATVVLTMLRVAHGKFGL